MKPLDLKAKLKKTSDASSQKSAHALSRRSFLANSVLGGAGLLILSNSRTAFSYEANSKLNVAAIGVAGRGRPDIETVANHGENIVALCDVDQDRAAADFKKYPKARQFKDFRRMFDTMSKEIDAVIVATPDHTHAVAAAAALHRGKHVYCEKPLTRTVHESRVLRELARKNKVVTQMGNQGSASDGLRRAGELAWSGALGEFREAYVWFPGSNHPMVRPAATVPVPATLDWDLWLGPAEFRPYEPEYAPEKWRAWRAFGSGIIGDFGCHTGNLMFHALKLDQLWNPNKNGDARKVVIRLETTPSEYEVEGYPRSMVSVIDIPARGEMPPVKLTFNTGKRPPVELMLGYPQGDWGDLVVGSKGSVFSDNPWNTSFALLPEDKFSDIKHGPPQSLLQRCSDHHIEWVEACKGNGTTFSNFDIGGPMTELMQLINLSTLCEGPLEYDTLSGKILNSHKASRLLHRDYRRGWKI